MGRFPGLAKKVKSALISALGPTDKVTISEHDGLIGIVVSNQFEDMDDMDRQDLVWNILDQKLTREERGEIAIIVTVTPREEAAHLAAELD